MTCVPTDRVVQMIAADGTPYVGVEWAGDRTIPLRDRSDIEKCNKSRAETAMDASSKKDAKETEAETEPPGTPAKEEGSAPPEQQSTPVDRPPPRMQIPRAPDGWQCLRAFDDAMDQLTMHACGVCSETWFSDMRSARGGGGCATAAPWPCQLARDVVCRERARHFAPLASRSRWPLAV